MNKKLVITLFTLVVVLMCVEAKKSFKSRTSSSARGSGRKTNSNPHPAPTSLSYPQPSAPKPAPKPSLFGWQEKSQPKPSSAGTGQSHSYPSSNTGLSGNNQPKQPSNYQESVQRNSATSNLNGQQAAHPVPQQTNSHSYPSSNGLSGNSGGTQQAGSGYPNQQKTGYPQQTGSGLSGSGAAPPPYSPQNNGPAYQGNNYGNSYHHPQGPPPPYSNHGGYGGHYSNPGYGAPMSGYSPQAPGYFGNYANNNGNRGFGGGMSRGPSALTGVGIAGAGVGTLLTGLALWNLARSTGNHRHTVIYDNRGQPVAVAPSNSTEPVVDPLLADLINCTLSISNSNSTEVLAIPCAIATSFTPDTEVKALENGNPNDNTKCTVTIVNKSGREFETTIPCSVLLNTAAENNVTEPPPLPMNTTENLNGTMIMDIQPNQNQPSALSLNETTIDSVNSSSNYNNCTPQPGEIRDPINPCYAITHNVTVLPLPITEKSEKNDE